MQDNCRTCAKQPTCDRKECKKITYVSAGILEQPERRNENEYINR